VYDGAGILPDVKTEETKPSNILVALITKNHVFNYATQYVLKHPSIAPVKNFELTEEEYNDFIAYLKDRDYRYVTESEETLNELKEVAEGEKYYENIKKEFDALSAKMKEDKKDDLVKFKSEIKDYLEGEIASRYYFQTGRIEQALKKDQEVKTAIELFSNEGKYKGILTTIEKPTKPFNLKKRF
jgi:carboxyl-terminal processing protease